MEFKCEHENNFWEECVLSMLKNEGYSSLGRSVILEIADEIVENRRKRLPNYILKREDWPDHWKKD